MKNTLSKVPQITLMFWIAKLITTGMGESLSDFTFHHFQNTTGDQVRGALITFAIFGFLFLITFIIQMKSKKYHPMIYWITVAVLALFGTICSDIVRAATSLTISSLAFTVLTLLSFTIWHKVTGSLSVHHISNKKSEFFYWLTVGFSFMLGTAVGDFMDKILHIDLLTAGLSLGLIMAVFSFINGRLKDSTPAEIITFWLAYILTRPVGACLADFFGYIWHHGILGTGVVGLIWLIGFVLSLIYFNLQYKRKRVN